MRLSPIAADSLPDRIQSLAAGRPQGKFQDKPLCVWTTHHLKRNGSEQPTARAECQPPISSQFMDIEARTLDIAQLALRIMSTRAAAAHAPSYFDEISR
jgi:hypothetical protein